MTSVDLDAVVTALPSSDLWEYGGHPYGLEPLALPVRWLPRGPNTDAERIAILCEQLEAGCAAALASSRRPADEGRYQAAYDLAPADAFEIDRVFWFRWITGHQATFIFWQFLAEALDAATRDGADRERLARESRLLLRGFSLMLLYASSPPRDIYDRVIRMPMARQHPNLSGSWARDYAPLRSLIRGKISFGPGPEAEALRQECALNERIHEGIAHKVVPSGKSLLQQPNVQRGPWRMPRQTAAWLYDGIFMTSRMAISHPAVVRQLVRRLHGIALDLSANGLLPPYAPSGHEEPPALATPDVMACKQSAVELILDLIKLVGAPGVRAASGVR